MKKAKEVALSRLILPLFLMLWAQSAPAQNNRIPPVEIDNWFNKRYVWVVIIGASLGGLFTAFWLPLLLPKPHKDDNRRALKHFACGLLAAAVLLILYLLIDASNIYQFGSRSFAFREIFSDVFLSGQTLLMIFLGLLAFAVMVTVVTRLSNKSYRYMLFPW